MPRPARGPAAAEHGARLPHPLGLGRHPAAPASCPARPSARGGGRRGRPDYCGDHRRPEREERGKRGSRIDPSGCDAAKEVKGKKRHILVDALGLPLNAAVHPAGIQDRDGAIPLLRAARRLPPFVEAILAEGAYQGGTTAEAVAKTGRRRRPEIVRRGDGSGFVPSPERWLVERTSAWLGRRRRLAKDFENLAVNALAFLAEQQRRTIEEVRQTRDDMRVTAAMVQRLDGTVAGLVNEVRAEHARYDHLDKRLKRLEPEPAV